MNYWQTLSVAHFIVHVIINIIANIKDIRSDIMMSGHARYRERPRLPDKGTEDSEASPAWYQSDNMMMAFFTIALTVGLIHSIKENPFLILVPLYFTLVIFTLALVPILTPIKQAFIQSIRWKMSSIKALLNTITIRLSRENLTLARVLKYFATLVIPILLLGIICYFVPETKEIFISAYSKIKLAGLLTGLIALLAAAWIQADELKEDEKTSHEKRLDILLGIEKNKGLTRRILVEYTEFRFPSVSIEVIELEGLDHRAFMQKRVEESGARIGVILDAGLIGLDVVAKEMLPIVRSIELQRDADDFEAISGVSYEVAHAVKAIKNGEDDMEALKILGQITDSKKRALIELLLDLFSPVHALDIDTVMTQLRADFQEAGTSNATITTSNILKERPEILKGLSRELSSKDRNILVVTEPEIRLPRDKEEYVKALRDSLIQSTGIDINNIFDLDNIVTFRELERDIFKKKITRDNATLAAEALAESVIGDYGTIIYVGGEAYFTEELRIASIIKGVFEGDEPSIREALNILGRDTDQITPELLRKGVIDLRGTTELQRDRDSEEALRGAV